MRTSPHPRFYSYKTSSYLESIDFTLEIRNDSLLPVDRSPSTRATVVPAISAASNTRPAGKSHRRKTRALQNSALTLSEKGHKDTVILGPGFEW